MSNTITKEQAKSLAVNYAAYEEAYHDKDAFGIRVWGRGLKDIQQETGITLIDDENLEFWINQAAARFVGISKGGTLWVAHNQGNSKDTLHRFKDLCAAI